MNKAILIGRVTKDSAVSYNGEMCIARNSIAIDRLGKDKGADFINLVAFGKTGEVFEKHISKGTKIAVEGHIQTGSYKNKEGNTVYTTDVIVDKVEFCESKGAGNTTTEAKEEGFMSIPDAIDEELPFM